MPLVMAWARLEFCRMLAFGLPKLKNPADSENDVPDAAANSILFALNSPEAEPVARVATTAPKRNVAEALPSELIEGEPL